MNLFASISALLVSTVTLLLLACSKPDSDQAPTPPAPPPNPGTGTTPSTFVVDGKWECLVDGIPYSGTVDTSYVIINQLNSRYADTTIWCTGTSSDKRANIHFRLTVNRSLNASSSPIIGHFTFDTTGNIYLRSSNVGEPQVTYVVDTLQEGKLKAHFSGKADALSMNGGGNMPLHTITEGKFSCEFGKGNGEPKFFSYTSSNKKAGFIRRARLLTNEMILEGIALGYSPDYFRLVVRTGGTVEPGIYRSSLGEAGLRYFIPSINTDYVNDSLGDLTVNITSVSGAVVEGTFSGVGSNGVTISGGTFSCRLKDYQPQSELDTRWQFSFDEQILGYNCYGGNITSAVKTQAGNRYKITVNGESDNHTSVYKIVLSSNAPLTTGSYRSDNSGWPNLIDSAYFRSNELLWNGNTTYLFSESSTNTWCRIDSLDANKIVGTLYGKMRVFYSRNGYGSTSIKLGTFRGRF